MKINRLQMQNFRNHTETTIELDRINFFAGRNNAGKSSILAAIEWALTGRCMWTDRAGRGASDLVRQGEKQASVALDVDGLGAVIRSLPPHSLRVGNASGVNEGQAALQNYLRADEARLQLALNTNTFLGMNQAEQRAFLFSAFGLSWTVEQVPVELTRWLIAENFSDEEALRLAVKAKRYYPVGIIAGPEIFEAMEKRAKEERKELKKDKQRAQAALLEISPVNIGRPLPDGIEESKSHLAELNKNRDELLKACGAGRETQIRRQALLEKIGAVDENLAGALVKAESLTAELDSLGGEVDGSSEAEASQNEKSLQDEINAANKATAAARSKLEAINKAGTVLTSGERRCPLAPDLLQCGLTQDQLDTVLSSLRNEYKTVSLELERQEAAVKDLDEKLAAVRSDLTEIRTRSKRILFLQGELNTQQNLADTLEASKEEMNKELSNLPEEDQVLLEDLAQLEAAINQIETSINQYYEAQALAARLAALEQDVETISAEVDDQEILVKALGPDGLRKDLLAGILEGFVGRVNDRLGRLTEGTYHLYLTPEMNLLCRANGGPLLPLKLLSKSEQLRVGIAISEALSAAAGLKFLAIDEADMLDQENRDLLAGMLLGTVDEYDQVLVFTTVGDVQPENPNLPGVKMFWVEDGTVSEL